MRSRDADHHATHFAMLRDIGELLAVVAGSTDLQSFLDQTVRMVAEHLRAAVCSIYLVEGETSELVLRATVGLNPASVGRVRLVIGEGLVGTALQELRPVCEREASRHPQFRYFPETREEAYDAFLAVPIQRGVEKVGVLVVQRESGRAFGPEDVSAMQVLTSQLAGAIESARALLVLGETRHSRGGGAAPAAARFIRGRPGAPGCATARLTAFRRRGRLSDLAPIGNGAAPAEEETARFEAALARTAAQLTAMQAQLETRLPEAASLIFDAHLLMLKDRSFTGRMRDLIREGVCAEDAVVRVAHDFSARFLACSHDYLREKAEDVEDLALRILAGLEEAAGEDTDAYSGRIVIARDLLPSDMLKIALENVRGVILASGGVTSHVAIIARSLQIPLVIVDTADVLQVPDGTPAALDGDAGNVYIRPSDEIASRFRVPEQARQAPPAEDMAEQTFTADGERIRLLANINLLSEVDLALRLKAEGVGLYRTELPFLVRDSMPSCDEQSAVYRTLFDRMAGREVTVRTLDAGGDKMLAYFDNAGEPNPELGLRSTRLTLRHPDIFEAQVRAILTAAAGATARIRIMFPMIASIDEFSTARKRLLDIHRDLAGDAPPPPIGMMLELPAAAEQLEEFAAAADFFAIGTNDYVQYMLAADRANQRVADYYVAHHPAVTRSLARMIGFLAERDCDVSVCGEMAHDVRYVPFFVGAGVRKLSVDPSYLPAIQACIAGLSLEDAVEYTGQLCRARSVREAEALVRARQEDA